MPTIDLIKNIAINKSDIFVMTQSVRTAIESGEIDPMLLQQHFKAVEVINEAVKEPLRKAVIAEMQKHPEKTVEKYGAEFKLAEFGTKYDYSGCGDPIWHELSNQIKELTEKMKKREVYLKSLDSKTEWINPATAELCELYPPVKTSTTSVSCSIK